MAVSSVSSASSTNATAAYGLNFQTLLSIIMTELTYQDPLKPLDNFQFVSQLGQFAQLQQSQSLNDTVTQILSAQASNQAVGLLGKTVDLANSSSSSSVISGTVTAITFSSGQPQLTIELSDGSTVTGLSVGSVSQVR
jgi:flagellar basal-body rod modification protein FlgD